VCHTDLHAWKGDWPLEIKLPLVGGHEGAGVIVQVGELVKDLQVGDHAGIKWLNGSCGACDFCTCESAPLPPPPLTGSDWAFSSNMAAARANRYGFRRAPLR